MSCKEVVTFRLDMGAPISLLFSRWARLRVRSVAWRVKSDHPREARRFEGPTLVVEETGVTHLRYRVIR